MEPRRVGPYRLERQIGAGGMGVVFAAWDERLGRRVALKQIRPDKAGHPLPRERFRREARAVAQLDHPAIVRIHDLLETPEGDWLVLQYVEGNTLSQRLRQGPLPPRLIANLARDILGALEAAHAGGFLHRDLKTENVVLAPAGHALVLDFGLAKLWSPEEGLEGDERPPGTTGVIGTFRAMSPEQANGQLLDPRSDLFSLGVLLYEAATGISPFEAKTPVDTLTRVCTHQPVPAQELAPALPERLARLIDALLEKDAERRPRSASAALAALGAGPKVETVEAEEAEPTVAGFTPLAPPMAPLPSAPRQLSAPEPGSRAATAYRALRPGRAVWISGLAGAALALAFVLLGRSTWLRPRTSSPSAEPLYVAVARPEIGLGAGREEVALAAAALQEASLRALASLSGVAAVSQGRSESGARGEGASTLQRLARLLAVDEVLTSTLECQAHRCQAVLRRQEGGGGRLIESTAPFEVPLDDLPLLATAASAYLQPLYPGFRPKPGEAPLQVRDEDYQSYLRTERTWEEERPANLEPLLSALGRIRAGSPLFLDAYLLEARIEGFRFFQTRDAAKLDQALARIAEARRLAPADPRPLDTGFDIALSASRLDEAEEILRALERSSPGDARTMRHRALLAERQGNRKKALELLREATRRRPDAAGLMTLANMEMRVGEIPAARSTLEGLVRRVPGHSGGENLLAQLELEGGSPARAAELYAGLARRSPSFAALSNLGLSELLLGRYPQAATSLRRAYQLAPLSYAAALNLGDVEQLLGRQAEGEILYRQVLALTAADPAPEHWQVLTSQAQAQAHLGRRTEAATTIQRAIVVAPDNPEVAYSAALVDAVIGDTASALANVERALALGYNRRWFALPWFEPLRGLPRFRELLAPEAGLGATGRPAAR